MSAILNKYKKNIQYTVRDVKNSLSKTGFKPKSLNAEQQLVFKELQDYGFVKIPIEKLLTINEWEKYSKDFEDFLNNPKTIDYKKNFYDAAIKDGDVRKSYIIRGQMIYNDFIDKSGLASFNKNTFLRPIIDNYFGLANKMVYADYWYTLKTLDPSQDIYSQAWHCDPEGDKIVKIFILIA